MILAKRISEKEKKQIINDFLKNKSLDEISNKFSFTKLTITRFLKKSLGEEKYTEYIKNNKPVKRNSNQKVCDVEKISDSNVESLSKELSQDSFLETTFLEITPLNLEIDNLPQKDLTSVSISEAELPKVVYMVVDKQIELETKLLKEYSEWNFLSENDLSRNSIEIFFDLKTAKRSAKKDQRVIKVPNSDVFKITAPILRARGISRIVSSDLLIAI